MLRYVDAPEDVCLALAKEYAAATRPSRKKPMRAKPSRAKPSRAKGTNRKTLPKHIPVVATSNYRSTRTTLVPGGAGRYRLQVNSTLRKAAHADVGEVIGVSLRLDLGSLKLPVPPELQAALKSRPHLKKEFDLLTTAGRMQFLRFYAAKSPEVRKKRLVRLLEVLSDRALNRKTKPARNEVQR